MKQKILAVDSQILNEIQNCARKAELAHIKNLRPLEKADALEKGDLMHKMLQTYYSLKLGQVSADLWDSLTEAGVNPSDKPQDAAISGGYFFAAKSSLPEDISQEVIFQFREYVDHYKHDSWSPLAVEEVGSKIMYEDEDLKIIYSFKIDLIAEKGNIVAPFDHKTGSTTKEPSSLSNQFIGYAWALGSNTVIVNKIGFQKTLSRDKRFLRYILSIDNERIEEWVNNSIWWLRNWQINHLDKGLFPMNLTSCDKYAGCIYKQVCERNPQIRDIKLEQFYNPAEQWDVARELEKDQILEGLETIQKD